MFTRRTIHAALAAALLVTAMTAGAASAHNAGHLHLPNGACLDVGSGNHHQNPNVDRYPETSGDEYGARWAADQGRTPIYPRFCADPRNVGDHPGH
jgi:hypothetical protein